jgi:hypothetical protein
MSKQKRKRNRNFFSSNLQHCQAAHDDQQDKGLEKCTLMGAIPDNPIQYKSPLHFTNPCEREDF